MAKVKADRSTMSDFLDKAIDKFGEYILVDENAVVTPISTGCLSLDVSIGIGGIPRGKVTEIYGSEGSGKTTIALGIAKSALHSGNKVLYLDVENMLDYTVIKDMIGEDFSDDRFVILKPVSAEDTFTLAEMAFNSGEFGLVVIDSIAALSPEKEKEDTDFSGSVTVGALPRLLSRFLRRNVTDSIKKNDVALLLLNQVRDKIGAYMATFETPGGHALKHFCSVIIALTKGQDIVVGKEKVGIQSKFVIRKNKLSAPFRSYTIPIIFGRGVDKYSDLVEFCTMLGVIKKSGAHYKLDDNAIGHGKIAAGEFISKNPDIEQMLIDRVYASINKYTAIDTDLVEEAGENE